MKPNFDDSRITAYVLGELDESERQSFESEMAANPELKQVVQAMQETTAVLQEELAKEKAPGWQVSMPQEILEGETSQEEEKGFFGGLNWKWVSFAGSALVAAALAGVLFFSPKNVLMQREQEKLVAQMPVDNYKDEELSALEPRAETKKSGAPRGDQVLSSPVPSARVAEGVSASGMQNIAARERSVQRGGSRGFAPKRKVAPIGSLAQDAFFHQGGDRDDFSGEAYNYIAENSWKTVGDHPLSTFALDVDTASYANVRRFLRSHRLPPKDAVRIEELINYFHYDHPAPTGKHPVAVTTEMSRAPWNSKNTLLKIGLRGKDIEWNSQGSNLVFLLDVSGSMENPDKLPLVRKALKLLVDNMTEKDRVAMVVYAGSSGLVLPSTSGDRKQEIVSALERLRAGGSTNGGAGIELAYQTAQAHFIKGGINRVILATDGDFNVGTSSKGDLVRLVQEKAKSGVFLSVLGFGQGNLQDDRMESLANKGNGNYSYIDSLKEAKKVLVEEMGGTLVTVAKDVKLQVEFNPAKVAAYRLIGYENRLLAKEDFNDDKKDAGEMGAGHTVTALYEIVPAGGAVPGASVDELKYQKSDEAAASAAQGIPSNEWLNVKVRYKQPEGEKSVLFERPYRGEAKDFAIASPDFKFAAAVAGFGMLLRDSAHKGDANFSNVHEWAVEGQGDDTKGYRSEFLQLIERAKALSAQEK